MADFKQSLKYTLDTNEEGWSHTPGDSGGETWQGISRNNWPQWEGWKSIDAAKKLMSDPTPGRRKMDEVLFAIPELRAMVATFYQRNFWPLDYSLIDDQTVATKLFDWGVNMGTEHAVKCLQSAVCECGVVVSVDGCFGRSTLNGVNSVKPSELMVSFVAAAKGRYRKIVSDHPEKVGFLNGWLARADRMPPAVSTENPAAPPVQDISS